MLSMALWMLLLVAPLQALVGATAGPGIDRELAEVLDAA